MGKWKYNEDEVIGNDIDGFDTVGNWMVRLGIAPYTIKRRIVTHGKYSRKTVAPKKQRGEKYAQITDPFTGITTHTTEHAKRLKINPNTLTVRIKTRGLNDRLTWKKGQQKTSGRVPITSPIWEREKYMKLRKNPFTGQFSYDYEWAELYNMTIGSFRDRLTMSGADSIEAWSVNNNPRYEGRGQ